MGVVVQFQQPPSNPFDQKPNHTPFYFQCWESSPTLGYSQELIISLRYLMSDNINKSPLRNVGYKYKKRAQQYYQQYHQMKFEQAFQKLARLDYKNKGIMVTFMLTITAIFGLGIMNLHMETDPQGLWVSHDSEGYQQEMYFNQNFGAFFRTNQLVVTQTNRKEINILQKKYLYALAFIEQAINKKAYVTEGKSTTVDDLCFKPIGNKGCYHPSPLDIWLMNVSDIYVDPDIQYTNLCIESRDPKSRIPCSDKNGIPVLKESIYGGTTCQQNHVSNHTIPCGPCWTEAKTLSITYLLNNDFYTQQNALDWEKYVFMDLIQKYNADNGSFIEQVKKLGLYNITENGIANFSAPNQEIYVNINDYTAGKLGIKIQYLAERSITDELANETDQNMWVIIISYIIMFLYVGVAIGKFPSFKESGFTLALQGILIVICSVVSALGISSFFNLSYTMISVEVIPFLILAIGVDNMFIIKNAYGNQAKQLSIENKLAFALKEVGPSITTAAVCQALAFFVGSLTKMPALQSFCVQAGIAVLFDYLFQITAFVAFLAWDEKRKEQNRMDLFCCIKPQQQNIEDEPIEVNREAKMGFWKRVFRDHYANLMTKWPCFLAIMLVFFGLVTAGILGCMNIPVGLNEQVSMETESDLFNYFTSYKKYIEIGPPAYLILENFDYQNPEHLEKIDELANGLSRLSMVQPPLYSWIGVFNNFIQPSAAWEQACQTQTITQYSFQEQLKRFIDIEIGSPCCQTYGLCGEQFSKDIIFDEDGSIKTSRLRFQHKPLRVSDDYIKAAQEARQTVNKIMKDLTDKSPGIQAFPYSLVYVYYDQYAYIRSIAVQNLLLAVAAVLLALVIIQNLKIALIITVTVLFTTFNLIGVVYIDNLIFKDHGFVIQINAISVVNIITCVGLAVEFSAHIAIAFLKATGTKEQKLRFVLQETGSSVFIGIGLTKFIGVIVLAFAKSTLFRLYYFRMYLGIVLMGIFHGLVLLPCVLYRLSPNQKDKYRDEFGTDPSSLLASEVYEKKQYGKKYY